MNANKETHSRVLAVVQTPWQGVCTRRCFSAFSVSSAVNCLCRIGVCLRSFFLKKINKLVNVIILQPLRPLR